MCPPARERRFYEGIYDATASENTAAQYFSPPVSDSTVTTNPCESDWSIGAATVSRVAGQARAPCDRLRGKTEEAERISSPRTVPRYSGSPDRSVSGDTTVGSAPEARIDGAGRSSPG
jgi:hypothetical protein